MIFKCKNCGGNILYNPDKGTLCCPNCDSLDSEDKLLNTGVMTQCANCGAPMDEAITDYTSATKCPNCGTYTILEERVDGEDKPDLVLPFRVSKTNAIKAMKDAFGKKVFTPAAFLSHATVNAMEGNYVPFYMYDYDANGEFIGQGTKVRTWSDEDFDYTETSYFDIVRKGNADYSNIPADASEAMEDGTMDLMEPYNYEELTDFDPKYMSGFMAEKPNGPAEQYEDRVKEKLKKSMDGILRDTIIGYDSVTGETSVSGKRTGLRKALMPIWQYTFHFQDKDYQFTVNGQTGKVVGEAPVDKSLVIVYGATVFAVITIVLEVLRWAMM